MVKGLYTASTGMINEQKRVDVVANNLANVSTTGYKAEGATSESFKNVLAYKIKDTSEYGIARKLGTMSPGVKIGETYVDHSEGAFHTTDIETNMAISGKGFFTMEFTNKQGQKSTMYTRDGSFIINTQGNLVNKNGDYVLDINNQRITLDPLTNLAVDVNGNLIQNGQTVTQLKITDFEDYNYLEKYGENYFVPVDGATQVPEEDMTAVVYNGMLESSNVKTAKEMVDMISYQRAYEANQKMIHAHDETIQVAVNDLGKL